MSLFTPQAARARHEYFDKTMSEAGAMLHDSAVVAILGQAAITNYQLLLDCYYVPNIRHDTIHLPKIDAAEKGVPVVPVSNGDNFTLPVRIKSFHPLQLVQLKNRLLDWGFSESSAQSTRAKIAATSLQRPLKIGFDADDYGAVNCVKSNQVIRHPLWDNPLPVQLFGAPHVALNMSTQEGELEEALTLLHETKHIYQYMTEPIVRDNADMNGYADRKEQEAIYLEERIQGALYGESKNPKYSAWAPLEEAQRIQ